jgi:hypothetical protein
MKDNERKKKKAKLKKKGEWKRKKKALYVVKDDVTCANSVGGTYSHLLHCGMHAVRNPRSVLPLETPKATALTIATVGASVADIAFRLVDIHPLPKHPVCQQFCSLL